MVRFGVSAALAVALIALPGCATQATRAQAPAARNWSSTVGGPESAMARISAGARLRIGSADNWRI